jgi:hypothetical protein
MPSVSKKQHNFMEAVANNPKFAKKVGIPKSVGEEFAKADKGKQFKRGGEMAESKKMVKKEVSFMKAKGAPKSMIKHEMAEAGMKKGGRVNTARMNRLEELGRVDSERASTSKGKRNLTAEKKRIVDEVTMKKGGCTKMVRGGGVEIKGKTKGKNLGDSGPNVGIQSGARGMKRGGKC